MEKDKLKGIAGTLIFHAILVLALIFLALRTPLPLPEEAGVEVNLGYSDDGMGDIQPRELAMGEPKPAQQQSSQTEEEFVTEDTEEAPAVQPVKKDKPAEVIKPEPKPVVKPEPKPEPKPVVNPNAMYGGKQGTGTQGGNEGITGKPGDQGKTTGDPNAQGYDGTGGSGGGVSFDLAGRSSKQMPKPPNTFRESGIVVVTIYVNREGKVTRVITGAKGTTTSSPELRELARQAAMKAQFSQKDDAPDEQKGSITYRFELN